MSKTVYIDYHALAALALTPASAGRQLQDLQSMRYLWKEFHNDRINFVTSEKDMETDIILSLNRQGCCITDTLRAEEAIDEFGKTEIADEDIVKYWKRIMLFFEQIEALPQAFNRDPLFDFFRNDLLCYGDRKDFSDDNLQRVYDILLNCTNDLHLWYSDKKWNDLKYIDYRLNRDILLFVIKKYNFESGFDEDNDEKNRKILGLVNRVIGLCKKSQRILPIDKNHADFIIKTVLKKYNYDTCERNVVHMFFCARSNISFFLTVDYDLIKRFNTKKHLLQSHPEFSAVKMNVVSPRDMELQIRS